MDLEGDFKEFVSLLVEREVRFLVVGGFALAAHGLPRTTNDLDIWIWTDASNAELLTAALAEFGFGSLGIAPEDFTRPDLILHLGYEPDRIDVMTSIDGVGFDDAWRSRKEIEVEGIIVPVISKTHLVINKWMAGRPQDLVDLQKLLRQAQRE
jgi:hypothetical protein